MLGDLVRYLGQYAIIIGQVSEESFQLYGEDWISEEIVTARVSSVQIINTANNPQLRQKQEELQEHYMKRVMKRDE